MRREAVWFLCLLSGCGVPAGKPGAKPVASQSVAPDAAFALDTIRALDSALAVDTATIPESVFSAADSASPVGFRVPWTGDLDGMIQRRFIRVLVTPSRTSFLIDRGSRFGLTFEAMQEFETQLNQRLGLQVKRVRVMYIPVPRARLLTGLRDGLGDLAVSQIKVTPAGQAMVDFSIPEAERVREIVVTGAGGPELASIDALSGAPVYVRRSSSYWEHAETISRRLVAAGKAPIDLRPAPEALQDEDILEMVHAGVFPATIVDQYLARLWAQVLPGIAMQPGAVVSEDGTLAWAFRKGSPELEQSVNEFLRTHRQGTRFGNTLIRRYTQGTRFIAPVRASAAQQDFQQMLGLFVRFSAKYQMSTAMMTALAYQESRLNHAAVSPVGAIGVMQLMPATGRHMNVGDIRQLEPNIHAGIKYTHHLMEVYFPATPQDTVNRALLTFASYNAGPSRIRRLRREAAARGLDPDVWFGNVEILAAETLGRETVTYVSNIFKYYVAYQLMLDDRAAREAARATMR
jgi:membrane-bound lytic murein transglycosylase MltF